METGTLYRLSRGNQTQAVGIIVKGATASLQVYGSQSKPEALADMVDCSDGEVLTEGSYSYTTLPEYVYFEGTADSIEIVDRRAKDLDISF